MKIIKVKCLRRLPWHCRIYEVGDQLEMTSENAELFQQQGMVSIVGQAHASQIGDTARGNLHPADNSQRHALRTR
jgi:hypothetical protein